MSRWTIHQGDALETLKGLESASFDALLSDPPYGLNFMGKAWDHGVPSVEVWAEAYRCLKPGAFLLAFGGTRTFHRLTCAIEDAGFEIRDCTMFLYGSGFPKSHNFGCRCVGTALPYNHDRNDLRGVREEVSGLPENPETSCQSDMLQAVQRPAAGARVGDPRSQGGEGQKNLHGDEGREEPRMERGHHLQAEQGELYRPEVCSMPGGIPGDGAEGRLCDGTPSGHGSGHRAFVDSDGGGSPRGPQHTEQRTGKPGTLAHKHGAQTGRGGNTCPRCGKPADFVGYGTALKPAWEPCIVAMKPLDGTFAENAMEHGVAGINVEAGRVGTDAGWSYPNGRGGTAWGGRESLTKNLDEPMSATAGRWPANLILDEAAGAMLDEQTGTLHDRGNYKPGQWAGQDAWQGPATPTPDGRSRGGGGGASRFFYCPKASRRERDAGLDEEFPEVQAHSGGLGGCSIPLKGSPIPKSRNHHPCLKPLDLNRYLASLILPPKRDTPRRILVPFSGSGSEMIGALLAGWDEAVGLEMETDYIAIAEARLAHWIGRPTPLVIATPAEVEAWGPLFDGLAS